MSLDKLKLNKELLTAMTQGGFLVPKEMQQKVVSRIIGGQDVIAIGPEGSGKTTTYIIGVLMRLKYAHEEAPRALVLVPDAERITQVTDQFTLLNRSSLRVVGFSPDAGIQSQMDVLADGCDIVVTTPDRARALYMKLGLNLNLIQTFILDDADMMIKNGYQLPVSELARSIVKCQHLIFTEVLHGKLEQLIGPFMNFPATVEVTELKESEVAIIPQILYKVLNFKTKLNLLNLLMRDDDYFTKVVVFVNTRLTAQKLFKSLDKRLHDQVALYKPMFFDQPGLKSIEEFREDDETRIFIIANEDVEKTDLNDIPFILHFDQPEEKEVYISRVIKNERNEETLSIVFATDIELSQITKIEQATGQLMEEVELPLGLIIESNPDKEKVAQKKAKKEKLAEEQTGTAFHEKKASNAKTYNYSSKEKAKMKYKKR